MHIKTVELRTEGTSTCTLYEAASRVQLWLTTGMSTVGPTVTCIGAQLVICQSSLRNV